MWRELVENLIIDHTFFDAATPEQISDLEGAIDLKLPDEFKSLLSESNGIWGEYQLGLIWSTEHIQERNLEMRSLETYNNIYMPFDNLLFIAEAGNGDLFAYTIIQREISRTAIFAWNHENDSRIWVAPSLEKYLEWWLGGKIQL